MTKKQEAWSRLLTAWEKVCEHRAMPVEEYSWIDKLSNNLPIRRIDQHTADTLKLLEFEVKPATEKQLLYIRKLTDGDADILKAVDSGKLNRYQASGIIDSLKRMDELVYSRYSRKEDFDEEYDWISKILALVK